MKQKLVKAQVKEHSPLTDSIVQLILKPEEFVTYQAGQYLQILLGEEALNYSIANAPLGSELYELHIRHSLENNCIQALFAHIKKQNSVLLNLPFGSCCIDYLMPKPIIFIAVGTGFAPIKAMIEHLVAHKDPRTFELYWGARSLRDLYMSDRVIQWRNQSPCFKEFSFFTEESKDALVASILEKHAQDLLDWQIVISGPFNMVYKTRDALIASGVPSTHLFSDAFSFE